MQTLNNSNVRSVTQITTELKNLLESNYRFVAIRGEISNLKIPFSGHHYFTLKDGGAQIRSVLFKGRSRFLDKPIRDGQQVICRGKISVYEPRGEYQVIVDTVEQDGEGNLQLKFEQLKKKLGDEGLFDSLRKKSLPNFPERIAVISSPTGAAVQDFLKICRQRRAVCHIQIFPVPVQGEQSAPAIASAIELINKTATDVIVLCRGGGSLEDLWSFNEEVVARAIFGSAIPVITGIGHETDHTIADFCADMRAATPTGAAERVIPDGTVILHHVESLRGRLFHHLEGKLNKLKIQVKQQNRLLSGYTNSIEKLALRTDLVTERFLNAGQNSRHKLEERLNRLTNRLQAQAPVNRIALRQQSVQHYKQRLNSVMIGKLESCDARLARVAALLNGVSPLSTLARGYSIVQRKGVEGGEIVSAYDQVVIGEKVDVRLNRGRLECAVTGIAAEQDENE